MRGQLADLASLLRPAAGWWAFPVEAGPGERRCDSDSQWIALLPGRSEAGRAGEPELVIRGPGRTVGPIHGVMDDSAPTLSPWMRCNWREP
jgi:hypothetical protein